MIFRCVKSDDLEKAKSYAERLMKTSKYGIVVDVRKRHPLRTTPQNKYYWVIVKMLADELGYIPEEMHEILKHKFLTIEKRIQYEGKELETITIVKSTTRLSTVEFEDYLEKVRIWANVELGILLPLPNEILDE